MKKKNIVCLLMMAATACLNPLCGQQIAIKNNLLYDATASVNLALEFALADNLTVDVSGSYNPWVFPQKTYNLRGDLIKEYNGKFKHLMIQPELRWWPCEKFSRHFLGLHAHYAVYNVGGLDFLPDGFGEYKRPNGASYVYVDGIQNNRFEGWLAGAGVAYGYHLLISTRFSMEFTLGLGYTFLAYDKYKCGDCGEKLSNSQMHFLGPTKAGLTAIFMIQ